MVTGNGWNLADLPAPKPGAPVAMSTFSCGGGATMGYKRAGYRVAVANDIDPEMRDHYVANHKPEHYLLAPIGDLAAADLPDVCFNLDLLDGSPPCSTFSTAGLRDAAWGREKRFREGQAVQVLDDLFFDFIALVARLQPKTVVAENVTGMLKGKARGYTRLIVAALDAAGYDTQMFQLDAVRFGIPQDRRRVFFTARRKDLGLPPLTLTAPNVHMTLGEATADLDLPWDAYPRVTPGTLAYRAWHLRKPGERGFGEVLERTTGRCSSFNSRFISRARPLPTLTTCSGAKFLHEAQPVFIHPREIVRGGTFPDDYKFAKPSMIPYLIGMSVPPQLTQAVAEAVRDQWLTPAG